MEMTQVRLWQAETLDGDLEEDDVDGIYLLHIYCYVQNCLYFKIKPLLNFLYSNMQTNFLTQSNGRVMLWMYLLSTETSDISAVFTFGSYLTLNFGTC